LAARGDKSAYRTTLDIPADYAGHRVLLRFDGVSNAAKIWVNGRFVRDHWGSFMPFTCDITDFVQPGKPASLVIGVDDSKVGLAQYVRAGGLQRDVKFFAEPLNYITRFHLSTDFDSQYRDATMKVWLRMDFHGAESARVQLSLKDAQGQSAEINRASSSCHRQRPRRSPACQSPSRSSGTPNIRICTRLKSVWLAQMARCCRSSHGSLVL